MKPYYETKLGKLYNGDCLDLMSDIPDGSVDMVMVDPPYGITACKWDSVIPLEPMWKHLKRVIKKNGAVVMTAGQPFTSALVMSNPGMFKYSWIWKKAVGSNFATLKYQPMKEHEDVLVFGINKTTYYPIMETRKGSGAERIKYKYNPLESKTGEADGSLSNIKRTGKYNELRNPSSVQFFNNREGSRGLHPTQKPVALMEYLIKTYTNECEMVLDFACGSGTTAIACERLNRKWIGIEISLDYCRIAKERIEKEQQQLKLWR